jgi:hypothetical protein
MKKEENPERLKRLAGLNRKISKGAERVLKFLAEAGIATPQIIKIATGYSLKTIEFTIMPELLSLGLTKHLVIETKDRIQLKARTNAYAITKTGIERTGIKSRRKKNNLVNISHRLMVALAIAYLWRKFNGEMYRIYTEGQWKRVLKEQLNIDFEKRYPIPDAFAIAGETKILACIEAETGRSFKRLEEKVRKYNTLKAKIQQQGYALLVFFIVKNLENPKRQENFLKRFEKVQKLILFDFKIVKA